MIVFALDCHAAVVTPLHKYLSAERVWFLVHCHCGPILTACWYRLPAYGETSLIISFNDEWTSMRDGCIGTVIRLFLLMVGVLLPTAPTFRERLARYALIA